MPQCSSLQLQAGFVLQGLDFISFARGLSYFIIILSKKYSASSHSVSIPGCFMVLSTTILGRGGISELGLVVQSVVEEFRRLRLGGAGVQGQTGGNV